MTRKASIQKTAKLDAHLYTRRYSGKFSGETIICRACEAKDIVDTGDISANALNSYRNTEIKRMNHAHKGCSDKWAAIEAERPTETQKLGIVMLGGLKEYKKYHKEMFGESDRELRAEEKAREELHLNDTIKFENGVLSFDSLESGKTYIVTKDNCSTNCEAANHGQMCFHRKLYSLMAGDDSNVIQGNFKAQLNETRRAA